MLSRVLWVFGVGLALYFLVDIIVVRPRQRSMRRDKSASAKMNEPGEGQEPVARVFVTSTPKNVAERAPEPPTAGNTLVEPQDLLPDLEFVLDNHFEATIEQKTTRKSQQRTSVLSEIFAAPALEGRGRLNEIRCSDAICKGIIDSESAESESFVLEQTFMSAAFDQQVPDAFSLTTREKLSNGHVLTTFYIHSQDLFSQVPQVAED